MLRKMIVPGEVLDDEATQCTTMHYCFIFLCTVCGANLMVAATLVWPHWDMEMVYAILLVLHVLAATIWTGGHLVLFFRIFWPAYRNRDPEALLGFERAYEPLGMGALLVSIITGLTLAWWILPEPTSWFDLATPLSRTVTGKLSLLLLTALTAAHARFRVIPGLNAESLGFMGWHVAAVTTFSVLFVLTGVLHRFGSILQWFF